MNNSTIPATVKRLFLSLAFSDLAVGLCSQLMTAIISAVMLKMASSGDDLAFFCPTVLILLSYFQYLLAIASFLNVIVIAFDRLLAVSLHLRYQELITPKRVNIALVSLWLISCITAFIFVFLPTSNEIVAAVILMIGYVLTTVAYVRIYKVVKYHQNQIYSQNQLQNAQTREAHRQRKSAYNRLFVSTFLGLLFSLFALHNIVFDKPLWNFISRSSFCVYILDLPEFIIKSFYLLLAVPRDSPKCKKHSKANISHEREHVIRKEIKLSLVWTESLFQCLCEVWKTKFSKKTNGLALGQKKMKNVKQKRIVYYKMEMVLRNWETTHD